VLAPAAIAWFAVPRSFDFEVESSASVGDIRWAFAEEHYWLARLKASGGIGRLDSLTVDADDSLAVVVVQDLRQELLSGLVAKFYPRAWQMVHSEAWSPIDSGLVRGEINIATRGAPGSGHGAVLLAPTPNGSRLAGTATVEFKVPLIGGQVENLIGRQLVQQLTDLLRFTTEWISENS
jgi:hypothetical protein